MKFSVINIISAFTTVTLLVSCNKEWLDAKADVQTAVPSNFKDFQALLDASAKMNYWLVGFGEVASDNLFVLDASWSSGTDISRNVYTWSHDRPYREVSNWSGIYGRVFYDNVVLDGLEKIARNSSNDVRLHSFIWGQALFNRACAFWSLAQHFSPVYNKSTADTDLGIPLRLNSDITEISKRSTLEETYDQVIKDLKSAMTVLPEISEAPTRASKCAAFGMLARVYLSMSEYDSAYVYSNLSLEINDALVDYSTLPVLQDNFGRFFPEVIFHDEIYTGQLAGFLTYNSFVDQELYGSYHENDLRKQLFFNISGSNITFKGNYSDNSDNLFGGLAVDELYLIRAESKIRLGYIQSGLDDLNNLLKARWKKDGFGQSTYEPISVSNEQDALEVLLKERRKELICRGLRWSDLRRLNLDQRFAVTLGRNVGGSQYYLLPNDKRYVFPIPDDIIEQTGMVQNFAASFVRKNQSVN